MSRILIIRNDRLGDFMLAIPVFAYLKKNLPQCHLTALTPEYTREIAQFCPYIDDVLLDSGSLFQLGREIKERQFEAAIVLFSTIRVALALRLAKIPYTLAPATKLAQIFYHHRLEQRRSRSLKPEYEYNLELACHWQREQSGTGLKGVAIQPPYWSLDSSILKRNFLKQHRLSRRDILIFIHSGDGGSASNISSRQYAQLANRLSQRLPECALVLTAGAGELQQVKQLQQQINARTILLAQLSLPQLLQHIAFCDLFISGSTGPLHMAGILNCKTVGFYPNHISSTALRWQTANHPDRRLSFSPPDASDDMSRIDMEQVFIRIKHLLKWEAAGEGKIGRSGAEQISKDSKDGKDGKDSKDGKDGKDSAGAQGHRGKAG